MTNTLPGGQKVQIIKCINVEQTAFLASGPKLPPKFAVIFQDYKFAGK